MGQVFNSLSFGVMKSGLMGIVFGVLMFVVFQVFNFAISALGAFVHSIRLVFLEMYGRFYEGTVNFSSRSEELEGTTGLRR